MRLKTLTALMPDGIKIIDRIDDFSSVDVDKMKTIILSGSWDGIILDLTDCPGNAQYDFGDVYRTDGKVFDSSFFERAPIFAFSINRHKPISSVNVKFHQGVCNSSRQRFVYEKFGEGIYSTPFLVNLLT